MESGTICDSGTTSIFESGATTSSGSCDSGVTTSCDSNAMSSCDSGAISSDSSAANSSKCGTTSSAANNKRDDGLYGEQHLRPPDSMARKRRQALNPRPPDSTVSVRLERNEWLAFYEEEGRRTFCGEEGRRSVITALTRRYYHVAVWEPERSAINVA
jgi:hypothetical protein